MRVLWVSTWFPRPLDTGSRIRVHHLLKALAQERQIHLVAFRPDPNSAAADGDLSGWGVSVQTVPHDPFRRDPRRALLGYLSPLPRDVVATGCPALAYLVRQAEASCAFDVAIGSCTPAARYLVPVRNAPRVLEEHNSMSRWMEEQWRTQPHPCRRALRWLTWRKTLHYERRLYAHFDACSVVSTRDSAAVRASVRYRGRLAVVPNGVDLEHNRPGLVPPQPDTLIFNGSLGYYANMEAVRFFVAEVLPLVRRERPRAVLRITGPTGGLDLRWLPEDGGVELTGYLEDLRPAVAGAWACVAPLRSGGGTRLKILEAMALGTPVVATSKGAEGLEVTPGQDIEVADEPAALAAQVVRLLSEPELRRRMSENGRALVEARYGWREIGAQFCRLVEAAANARGARP